MSDREPENSLTGQTKPTLEADSGQGAGPPKDGDISPGGPMRRSGRVLMREDAAARIGKPACSVADAEVVETHVRKECGRIGPRI